MTDIELTATHEAGHFVMGILAGAGLPKFVSIESNGTYKGIVVGFTCVPTIEIDYMLENSIEPAHYQLHGIRRDILVECGGPASEMLSGHWDGDEDQFTSDYDNIHKRLTVLDDFHSIYEYIEFASGVLKTKRAQKAIAMVANNLLECRTLNYEDDRLGEMVHATTKTLGSYRDSAYRKINRVVGYE